MRALFGVFSLIAYKSLQYRYRCVVTSFLTKYWPPCSTFPVYKLKVGQVYTTIILILYIAWNGKKQQNLHLDVSQQFKVQYQILSVWEYSKFNIIAIRQTMRSVSILLSNFFLLSFYCSAFFYQLLSNWILFFNYLYSTVRILFIKFYYKMFYNLLSLLFKFNFMKNLFFFYN